MNPKTTHHETGLKLPAASARMIGSTFSRQDLKGYALTSPPIGSHNLPLPNRWYGKSMYDLIPEGVRLPDRVVEQMLKKVLAMRISGAEPQRIYLGHRQWADFERDVLEPSRAYGSVAVLQASKSRILGERTVEWNGYTVVPVDETSYLEVEGVMASPDYDARLHFAETALREAGFTHNPGAESPWKPPVNKHAAWYNDLLSVIYEGEPDGQNERPDPRALVKEWKRRTRVAEFATTQATNCGKCGRYKHTPWRDDEHGYGYVCATCLVELYDEAMKALIADRDAHEARATAYAQQIVMLEGMQAESSLELAGMAMAHDRLLRLLERARETAPASQNERPDPRELVRMWKKQLTVEIEDSGHWSGRKCQQCGGACQDDEGRNCQGCAGTGEEWITYHEQVARFKIEQEALIRDRDAHEARATEYAQQIVMLEGMQAESSLELAGMAMAHDRLLRLLEEARYSVPISLQTAINQQIKAATTLEWHDQGGIHQA